MELSNMDEDTRKILANVLSVVDLIHGAYMEMADYSETLVSKVEELELRIRYLEGDPCSPPATADDFDLPEEEV